MSRDEIVGRAVALDEYVLTVDELQMLAYALMFRPYNPDDAVGELTEKIWGDLLLIDPDKARSAWIQARDSKKSDANWLIKFMEHLPKKEIKSL